MKRNLPLIIIAGVLVMACVAGFVLFRSKQAALSAPFKASQNASTPSVTPSSVTPVAKTSVEVPVPTNVSVAVEEYGDYQCPPCGVLHPDLKKIIAEYGPRIAFVFRNFPLPTIHKNALIAAQAAEAARLQGRFWEMHDRLYENQSEWKDAENPRSTFTKYARDLKLDIVRFDRDLDGAEVKQRIDMDTERANSIGVLGTPTIVIEGQQLKAEVTNADGIRKGINYMLTKKASKQ